MTRNASNRLSATPVPSTCQAGTPSAKPLSPTVPRSRYSNKPLVNWRVLAEITTAPGLRQGLEASREIWRLTNHRLLLGRSCSDQVADYYQPCRDPDTHLQRRVGTSGELWNSLDETEPGADRALRIVLMRLGVAEIRENTIAHVLGDKAAIALDPFSAAAVIGANDAPQVLGVEPGGECGRTDQVREHDRNLSTLGGVLGLRLYRGGLRCGRATKLLDSSKHYPPMSEQHAYVFEVLIGQMA
jgi:hypothetical protein